MENPYKKFSTVNPQRENGRREIANEVWMALVMAGLSGGEYQLVMVIIDRTWGFAKLSTRISLDYFHKTTLISRQGILKAFKRLEQKRIVIRQSNGTRVTEYLFNKHFDTWLITPARQPGFTSEGDQLGNQGLLDLATRVAYSWQPGFTSARQPTTSKTTLPKESRKKTIKENLKEIDGSSPPDQQQITFGASTPASRYLFEKTRRKRWPNQVQKDQFEKVEAEVGQARMLEAIDWALTSGISNIKSIITVARKESHGERKATIGTNTHRGSPQAPTREQYLKSLPGRGSPGRNI